MKRKTVWLLVSSLMVAVLVLASCGPAEEEEEEEVTSPPAEEEEVTPTPTEEAEVTPGPEVPKYGGTLNICIGTPVLQMDQATGNSHSGMVYNILTMDPLIKMSWAKGPAGTGEADMVDISMIVPSILTGALAESWDFPDPETIIVHLRQGVHFANKPPVNGRELVADDVVFTENRLYYEVPKAYLNVSFTPDRKPQSVTALDKYTVEFKIVPGMAGEVLRGGFDYTCIEPHEVFDQYGNMEDWTRVIGTGPFTFTDYVKDSLATFKRNPDYWEKDPIGPGKGNQLPYLDGVKVFLIQDASTRFSALRTGKLDHLMGLTWEDAQSMLAYSPELLEAKAFPGQSSIVNSIWMRTDTEPFDDIVVRRALCMAVDQPTILKELYGGEGTLLSIPVTPFKVYKDMYVPLEELPESAREQFEHHPDKARQLLAEAGYPDGFKTSLLCYKDQVDVASIVKSNLADIGVDMEIDVREFGSYVSLAIGRKYTQMVFAWGINANPLRIHNYRTGSLYDFSMIDDETVMQVYNDIPAPGQADEFLEASLKLKAVVPYILDQAWSIQLPMPYNYILWWPWLKNYHGEVAVGFHQPFTFANYVWIDQDLKYQMTGRR